MLLSRQNYEGRLSSKLPEVKFGTDLAYMRKTRIIRRIIRDRDIKSSRLQNQNQIRGKHLLLVSTILVTAPKSDLALYLCLITSIVHKRTRKKSHLRIQITVTCEILHHKTVISQRHHRSSGSGKILVPRLPHDHRHRHPLIQSRQN